ncbi:hypothetical protein GCM10023081_01260 [Arthrobacter ginkgonis]|uniref:Integral membrane protein n=1 Tax=Arthrobacter ginkgonis TaxID=1630594 RepID=A0ABP7BQN9_9MICC
MADHGTAADSLHAAAAARQRARSDSRWFSWACLAAGLLAIPGGTVVPWGWPARFVVTTAVFALAIGLVWLMARSGVTPRGGKRAFGVAAGCWFVLNALVAAIGRDIDHLGLGLVCSALASVPFMVVAVRFAPRRDGVR